MNSQDFQANLQGWFSSHCYLHAAFLFLWDAIQSTTCSKFLNCRFQEAVEDSENSTVYLRCSFGLLETPTDSFSGPLQRRDRGPDGPGWPFLCQVEHWSVLHHSVRHPFPSALQSPLKSFVRGHTLSQRIAENRYKESELQFVPYRQTCPEIISDLRLGGNVPALYLTHKIFHPFSFCYFSEEKIIITFKCNFMGWFCLLNYMTTCKQWIINIC